jgi:bifunctional non-homologous end joining protein LigD
MLATLTVAPFDDRNWVLKYDGFRMVIKIDGGKVTLYSRNGKIISSNYLEMAKAFEAVKGNAVIDGELVALDAGGVSHFQLLQNALRKKGEIAVLRRAACMIVHFHWADGGSLFL